MNIVCLGDSLTVGPMIEETKIWTALLDQETEHQVLNRGLSGDTTSGMLARLQTHVINMQPDYALIIGGTNDLIAAGDLSIVQNNLMAMVHHLFEQGVRPIVASPTPCIPDMVPEPWKDFRDFAPINDLLRELNVWTRAFAKSFYCGFADLHGSFAQTLAKSESPASYYLDGLHLSEQGHRAVADILKEYLETTLR